MESFRNIRMYRWTFPLWVEHTKCSGGWEISVQYIPFNFEHLVGPGAGNLNDYQSCGNLDILKTPSRNQIHHMHNYFSWRKILYTVLNVFADMQKVAVMWPLVAEKMSYCGREKAGILLNLGKLSNLILWVSTFWKYFNLCIKKF